jgi:hypothetical protein
MEYVKLGNTGMDVSKLVLGCMTYGEPDRGAHPWTLDEEASRPLIRQAVEAGINFSTLPTFTPTDPPKKSSGAPSGTLPAGKKS